MDLQISLSVAHSSEILRAGMIAIAASEGFIIAGSHGDAGSAIAGILASNPVVALIDGGFAGPVDGFDVARRVKAGAAGVRIVITSSSADSTHQARARAAGAVNCIPESSTAQELVAAIKNAAVDQAPLSHEPFALVGARLAAKGADAADGHLTLRERQVLRHLAYGLSNEEIAASLGIGLETVKTHVHKLLRKISMRDRTQVAVWAVKNGVV
jgi:DNA-binding NarL/FixJ family response regulator